MQILMVNIYKFSATREGKVDHVRRWRREEKGKLSEKVEAQVFVHMGFEGLTIISAGKDGGWERVPVP